MISNNGVSSSTKRNDAIATIDLGSNVQSALRALTGHFRADLSPLMKRLLQLTALLHLLSSWTDVRPKCAG
jgi:hypothetical protein